MSALLPGGELHSVRFERPRWTPEKAVAFLAERGVRPVSEAATPTKLIYIIRSRPYSSYATYPAATKGILLLVGR